MTQRMRVAPLVIIRAGRGDGLLWECERAFAMLSPGRLVILVMNLKGWRAEFVPIPLKIMKFGFGDLVKPFQQALRPVFAAARVSGEPNSGARQFADAAVGRKKEAALRIDSET